MKVERFYYTGKDIQNEEVVPVILVYLFGYIKDIPHLLLLRRGPHVAYMKNEWSIIAGVLNGDVDQDRQALVEIAGETGLLPDEVGTMRVVGTFNDEDSLNDKVWVRTLVSTMITRKVDHFTQLGVRLDWEHSEAAWVPVSTILSWLLGKPLEDPVAHSILYEEPSTLNFRLNLERMKNVMEDLVSNK